MIEKSRREAYRRIESLSARDVKKWPKWMQKSPKVRIPKERIHPEITNPEADY